MALRVASPWRRSSSVSNSAPDPPVISGIRQVHDEARRSRDAGVLGDRLQEAEVHQRRVCVDQPCGVREVAQRRRLAASPLERRAPLGACARSTSANAALMSPGSIMSRMSISETSSPSSGARSETISLRRSPRSIRCSSRSSAVASATAVAGRAGLRRGAPARSSPPCGGLAADRPRERRSRRSRSCTLSLVRISWDPTSRSLRRTSTADAQARTEQPVATGLEPALVAPAAVAQADFRLVDVDAAEHGWISPPAGATGERRRGR